MRWEVLSQPCSHYEIWGDTRPLRWRRVPKFIGQTCVSVPLAQGVTCCSCMWCPWGGLLPCWRLRCAQQPLTGVFSLTTAPKANRLSIQTPPELLPSLGQCSMTGMQMTVLPQTHRFLPLLSSVLIIFLILLIFISPLWKYKSTMWERPRLVNLDG